MRYYQARWRLEGDRVGWRYGRVRDSKEEATKDIPSTASDKEIRGHKGGGTIGWSILS